MWLGSFNLNFILLLHITQSIFIQLPLQLLLHHTRPRSDYAGIWSLRVGVSKPHRTVAGLGLWGRSTFIAVSTNLRHGI